MNILSPQLIWIENRCYRVNSTTNTNNYERETPLATNTYVEEGNCFFCRLNKKLKFFFIPT